MFTSKLVRLILICGLFAHLFSEDPLSSWNESPQKSAIIAFVETSTNKDSDSFIPIAERIAVFDNDGTLWAEQPMYFQLAFVMDQIHKDTPQHPKWSQKQPFKAILEHDKKTIATFSEKDLLTLVMATHAGMNTEQFLSTASKWLAEAKHPTKDRLYTHLVYQPMLELLAYLRAHHYKTYIVSGGGVDFLRCFSEEVYGIPPEQIIGSAINKSFHSDNAGPRIMREPKIEFINDKAGKPVRIQQIIGRRPVIAFGNSDGDFEMLEWTAAGKRPSLCAIIHHTDAEREWAYDRDSHIGKLVRGLDEAEERKWLLINMKNDWSVVFPEEK